MSDRKECNRCKYAFREKGLRGLWCKHTMEYVEGYCMAYCEYYEEQTANEQEED